MDNGLENNLKNDSVENTNSLQEWATNFFEDASSIFYQVVQGTVSAAEAVEDSVIQVVADIGGMFDEEFKESLEEFIATDYSSQILEPLSFMDKDLTGTEEGRLITNIASHVGSIVGGSLIGGPLGSVAALAVQDVGEKLEEYYQEYPLDTAVSVTYSTETTQVTMTAEDSQEAETVIPTFAEYFCKTTYDEMKQTFVDSIVVTDRIGETVLDMAGNIAIGTIKFGEGLVDDIVALTGFVGGLFNKDFQEQCSEFIQVDFANEKIGTALDNITTNSYLNNDSKTAQIITGVCQAIGQILPEIGICIATYGGSLAASKAAGVAADVAIKTATNLSRTVTLITLSQSVAGNTMESKLKDGVDYNTAFIFGQASGALEAGIESLGGLFGTNKLEEVIAEHFAGTFIPTAVVAVEEGLEEVVSGVLQPITEKIFIDHDKDLAEAYSSTEFSQELLDQFSIAAIASLITCGLVSKISTAASKIGNTQEIQIDTENLTDPAQIEAACKDYIETHPNMSEQLKTALEEGKYMPDENGKFSLLYENDKTSAGYSLEWYEFFDMKSKGMDVERQYVYTLSEGKIVEVNGAEYGLLGSRNFDLAVKDSSGNLTDVYELKVGQYNTPSEFAKQMAGTIEFMKENPNVNVHYIVAENAATGTILTNSSRLTDILTDVKSQYGNQFEVTDINGNEIALNYPCVKVNFQTEIATPEDVGSEYVSLDTEYNRTDLLQVSAVKVNNGQIVDTFDSYVNYQGKIDPMVYVKTHITSDMVVDAPSAVDVISQLKNFVGDDPLVGYNIKGADLSRIERVSGGDLGNNYFDLHNYVKANNISTPGNQSLTDIAQLYGINNPEAHNSLYDAEVTAQLFEEIKKK